LRVAWLEPGLELKKLTMAVFDTNICCPKWGHLKRTLLPIQKNVFPSAVRRGPIKNILLKKFF
jgi:hypothetical protein